MNKNLNMINEFRGVGLSRAQSVIAIHMANGLRFKDIAELLCVTDSTVKTHASKLYRVLDLEGRPTFMVYCAKRFPQLYTDEKDFEDSV